MALVAGLLALLVWKVAHQVGDSTVAAEVHKGKTPAAPAFDCRGSRAAERSRRRRSPARPQVVNFWASWCVPCRDEAALLQGAARRYGDRLAVIGIDHQDFAGDARGFVHKYGLTYPSVVDKGDKLYTKYGLTGVPETFCTDRRGRVVAHVPGAVTRGTLSRCIQDALSS